MKALGSRIGKVAGLFCALGVWHACFSAQTSKPYDFAAKPSDVQTVNGFLGVCGLGGTQLSPKSVEAAKHAPASDIMVIINQATKDKVQDEALCMGYVNGLYEGWQEGHAHGVLVAHLHGAIPFDLQPALKSMSNKEMEAINTEMKTDVPCVPDNLTFGGLRDAVVKSFRDEVNKTPFAGIAMTSRRFPYALLSTFPCPATQSTNPQVKP